LETKQYIKRKAGGKLYIPTKRIDVIKGELKEAKTTFQNLYMLTHAELL